MSAISYNADEGKFLPAGIPPKQGCTDAESEAGNFSGSKPSPRSSVRNGGYGRGHCEAADDDLITGAQCGDQQAFVELCGRYSSIVKNKIFRIVGNREDAEDALQDTLLRAYLNIGSFRRSCKFSTWLTAIGVNSALMIMRKRRARRETNGNTNSLDAGILELQEPVDRSLGPDEVYLKEQDILLVRREVEKLRPSLRSVVKHYYYESEGSLEEAANALNISLSAAKSRLSRGRVGLRSSLAGFGISTFGN
jgi:RNA polymerase sigma-70 factor (ECF subfamily)